MKNHIRARSEAGLSRLPVTEKIAGSNPVGPAKLLFTNTTKCGIIYLFLEFLHIKIIVHQKFPTLTEGEYRESSQSK